VVKNHNFWQILTFGGLVYRPHFTDEVQIWHATADQVLYLLARCSLNVFIVSASGE